MDYKQAFKKMIKGTYKSQEKIELFYDNHSRIETYLAIANAIEEYIAEQGEEKVNGRQTLKQMKTKNEFYDDCVKKIQSHLEEPQWGPSNFQGLVNMAKSDFDYRASLKTPNI